MPERCHCQRAASGRCEVPEATGVTFGGGRLTSRFRCLRIAILLSLPGLLVPDAHGSEGDVPPTETIVFLAPRGPFFVELGLTVDSDDYRDWLSNYLFDQLDGSKSGELTPAQLSLVPPRLLTRIGIENTDQFLRQIAADGEKISRQQFVTFIRQRLPASFLISEKQRSAVSAINVLPRFDANGDGHLSETELKAALQHQSQQDIDDDGTLSAAELLPFRDPANRGAVTAPNADDLPFLQVVEGGERSLAKKLLRYYAAEGRADSLTREATRLSSAQFAAADTDGDACWNVDETAAFLRHPQHHVRVVMRFSRRGKPSLEHHVLTQDSSVRVEPVQGRRDRVRLHMDGLPILIRCNQYLSSAGRFTRAFCGQRFAVADADGNKYLDPTEFTGFAGQVASSVGPLDFSLLDANKDEMVTREELFRHLDRDTLAAQSQLEVTVSSDGRSLFQMLDTNQDRRLSQRELMVGFAQLRTLDADGDSRISRLEAASPSQFTLEVGLGRPQLFRGSMMSPPDMTATDAVLRSRDSLPGPRWFTRMDRNRDGDISHREFLGTRQQFETLDRDHDGLIDASEAANRDDQAD